MDNFQSAYRMLYKYLDTFSGTKFIGIIKLTDTMHPDYPSYIEQRRTEGKSTIRKAYFKDILFSYGDDEKLNFFRIFLDHYDKSGGNREDIKTMRSILGL